MIWRMRHIPSREPIFHHREMLEGVGKNVMGLLVKGFNISVIF